MRLTTELNDDAGPILGKPWHELLVLQEWQGKRMVGRKQDSHRIVRNSLVVKRTTD